MTPPRRAATDAELDACAREPIHIPGSIQPHGVLFALDAATLAIRQCSANAAAFCGAPADGLAGRGIGECLGDAWSPSLAAALGDCADGQVRVCVLRRAGRALYAYVHRAAPGIVILEIESSGQDEGQAETVLATPLMRALAAPHELGTLLQAAVDGVRELTGFDRVLAYRFDEDGHGEVVAEARAAHMDSYLGHHYPESDIPRQARELYLRNWIRYIPDVDFGPVALVPAARPGGAPLDMSLCLLRSVSPVHLEYMANMGLAASMSLSLVESGRLWGLISCGHAAPRTVAPGARAVCESAARVVSLQIAALRSMELEARRAAAAGAMRRLVGAMRDAAGATIAALSRFPDDLLPLVGATGAAICESGDVTCVGECPPAEQLRELARWVLARAGPDGHYQTRSLAAEDPRWASAADVASGLLAITLPGDRGACVLWLRAEQPHALTWGGDPRKPARVDGPASADRLRPRRSFEKWTEQVRATSARWSAADLALARELRRSAIEEDLVRQLDTARAAVGARDDLVAVVSHDLRNPMSVVVMQAALMHRLLGEEVTATSKRLLSSAETIQRAGSRMVALLNDLLDLSKIEAGRFRVAPVPKSAAGLVVEAVQLLAYLGEPKGIRIVAESAPEVEVLADSERLFHVFSNLIGNAVKFTPQQSGVRVGGRVVGATCEFWVADEGPGLGPEALDHVFDRYWQARPSDARGAGLGLFIAKGIVEAHGGTIRAESAPDRGARFTFSLPLAAARG